MAVPTWNGCLATDGVRYRTWIEADGIELAQVSTADGDAAVFNIGDGAGREHRVAVEPCHHLVGRNGGDVGP